MRRPEASPGALAQTPASAARDTPTLPSMSDMNAAHEAADVLHAVAMAIRAALTGQEQDGDFYLFNVADDIEELVARLRPDGVDTNNARSWYSNLCSAFRPALGDNETAVVRQFVPGGWPRGR